MDSSGCRFGSSRLKGAGERIGEGKCIMESYGKSRGTFHAGGSDIMMPPQSPSHLALTLS